ETHTVDRDGAPLVFDLAEGTSSEVFVDTIADAIARLAGEVPTDISTRVTDGPDVDDGPPVDATRFVKRRQPACNAIPPAATCWMEPPGVSHEDAVAFTDEGTFFGVIPGTEVTFRVTFQNDFMMGGLTSQVYVAYIDVTAGGTSRLDRRQVYIVVPAAP